MPKRMPSGWKPPYAAYDAEFPPDFQAAVSSYFGAQSRSGDATELVEWFRRAARHEDGPEALERAHVVDREGYRNDFFVAYWTSPERYARWEASDAFRGFWDDPQRLRGPIGYWREVLQVPKERFEVNFSDPFKAGLTARATGYKLEHRHGYWGSARDRIPAADSDDLASPLGMRLPSPTEHASFGRRLRVTSPENLCVIRSGQDWSQLTGDARADYLNEMEPTLREGMLYLRDNPVEAGCCSNRYARFTDLDGNPREETAGIGHFLSLAHLEAWAASHPTHVAIFRSLMKLAPKLGVEVPLLLWHEVFVLPAEGQRFEYVNCHPRTGLLPWFEVREIG